MEQIVISGTGVFTPEESITNEELVRAYNEYAENYNLANKNKIDLGEKVALELSNEEFKGMLIIISGNTEDVYNILSKEQIKRKIKVWSKPLPSVEKIYKSISSYYDGNKKLLKADGLLATCIQHEMDHLEGILFIDYLSKLKRSMIIKKLSKLKSSSAEA